MNDAPIKVINVSKKYRINPGGLMDAINLVARRLNPKNRGRDFSRVIDPDREIWALKNVSFEVQQGEVLGIIGPNGAGKSTMLKILSGITRLTHGNIEVRGRVGALIEVGAGFHNELTGRENVYMNGSILGMKRKEIDQKFDEIVSFSGLDKFIDTPLKKYSSGMRVRLGFSIAVYMDPDVLLIDEVLSVGDIDFRTKSAQKMLGFKKKNIPIIFVSHSTQAIASICDRVLLLKNGQVQKIGPTSEIIEEYLAETKTLDPGGGQIRQPAIGVSTRQALVVTGVKIYNQNYVSTKSIRFKEDLIIQINYQTSERVEAFFDISIKNQGMTICTASMNMEGKSVILDGEGYLECKFPEITFSPGKYEIYALARDGTGMGNLMFNQVIAVFSMDGTASDYGFTGKMAPSMMNWYGPGMIYWPTQWRVISGSGIVIKI